MEGELRWSYKNSIVTRIDPEQRLTALVTHRAGDAGDAGAEQESVDRFVCLISESL